jgi:hypothetical protein
MKAMSFSFSNFAENFRALMKCPVEQEPMADVSEGALTFL